MKSSDQKSVRAWALYDWANSAFATTVMSGFFPMFFKQYWSAGSDVTESTFHLGVANSLAGLVVLILAPILGAIADQGGSKKKFLFAFMCLGVASTFALAWISKGEWLIAAGVFALGVLGYAGANVFYDSLLVNVSDTENVDRVSAFGFSLGYLGGGLLFAINVAMVLKPEWFGLQDAAMAVKLSFVTVAVWWFLFSFPLFKVVREPVLKTHPNRLQAIRAGFAQLWGTFQEIRHLKVVLLFLIAYWFYIDGVHTIIKMAVDFGISLGFDSSHMISALLMVQFIGFPCAILFGRFGEKLGTKNGIYIGVGIYTFVTFWGSQISELWEFYFLAVLIGLVQGGVQALSRSLYARIIPLNKAGEFFGFYNMMGKFAAILGPFLMGFTGKLTGEPRHSILSVAILFLVGLAFLTKVDVAKGRAEAQAFAQK